jgi:hypothetical protein
MLRSHRHVDGLAWPAAYTSPSIVRVALPKITIQCSDRCSWFWYDSRQPGFMDTLDL